MLSIMSQMNHIVENLVKEKMKLKEEIEEIDIKIKEIDIKIKKEQKKELKEMEKKQQKELKDMEAKEYKEIKASKKNKTIESCDEVTNDSKKRKTDEDKDTSFEASVDENAGSD